ncbi:MAG: signal recognition particle subunit SRP19/SEC65 family protein [Candidatus Bathyarchaeia archaeon]
MRRRGKVFLWPLYFEASISRREGRRLPKGLALRSVSLQELVKVSDALGIHPEVVPTAAHPSQPWRRTGVVLVDKPPKKSLLLRLVAEKMRENRSLGR